MDGSSRHALVQMDAALQTRDLDAAEAAEHEPAGVASGAGARKARQVGVVDRRGVLQRGRDPAQPGAEDQADPRRAVRHPLPDHIDGGPGAVPPTTTRLVVLGLCPLFVLLGLRSFFVVGLRSFFVVPGRCPFFVVLGRCPFLVVLGLDPRTDLPRLAEREGQRQQLADSHRAPHAMEIAEMDRHVGSGELGQALATTAAGRAQALAGGDHQRLRYLPLAGCDQRRDRARLGAVALGIAGVLDVGAGEDAPGCGTHRGAHPELRIRRMRVVESRARRFEQILHRRTSGRKV